MNDEIERLIQQIKSETDPFNKAKLLHHLNKNKDIRINKLASLVGFQPSHICHYLRLNRIPEMIIDGYYSKLISLSHLFIISRVKDKQKLLEIYEKILTDNLTIIQTEDLVRDVLYTTSSKGNYITVDEKKMLTDKLTKNNVSIKIIQTRIKGRIVIESKGSVETTTKFLREIINKLV